MTENEASKTIEALSDFNKQVTAKADGAYQSTVGKIACNMAIQALEKQIPKKPNLEGDGYADGLLVYDTWICPCCEKHYEVDYDEYDYCPNCGQAIDWSEVVE